MNWDLQSDVIEEGMPKYAIQWLRSARMQDVVDWLMSGMASGQQVN